MGGMAQVQDLDLRRLAGCRNPYLCPHLWPGALRCVDNDLQAGLIRRFDAKISQPDIERSWTAQGHTADRRQRLAITRQAHIPTTDLQGQRI